MGTEESAGGYGVVRTWVTDLGGNPVGTEILETGAEEGGKISGVSESAAEGQVVGLRLVFRAPGSGDAIALHGEVDTGVFFQIRLVADVSAGSQLDELVVQQQPRDAVTRRSQVAVVVRLAQ
ncbi:hypothetical protein ACFYO9_16275 [Streptomyces sp. NPDC005863]|uniref:hypothetical protein n=1 Tax=unclassified Streptomyces TaxID=2593676 RepID=UPI00340D8847